MQYAYLPFAAFLAAILVIIPVPWHWRARNIPTLTIMGWLFVLNISYGVNAIIWAGNLDTRAPVWCDITTKLLIGGQQAIPAAVLCVCRSLEFIAAGRVVYMDRQMKRRWMIFDCTMCIGVPIVLMAMHYVVQGHRFNIIENIGCQPATYVSITGIMIVWFPSLLFSVVSMVLAAAALFHFMRRRIEFANTLKNANPALTTQRYFRLMGMSLVVIVWNTAINAADLASNVIAGLRPWISWANVHSDFGRIDKFAEILLPTFVHKMIFSLWWAIPVSAYIVFMFFGSGEEATREYKRVGKWIRVHVFRYEAKDPFTMSLPSYQSPSKTKLRCTDSSVTELGKISSFGRTNSSSSFHSYSSPSLPDSAKLPRFELDKPLPTRPGFNISLHPSSTTAERFSLTYPITEVEVETPTTLSPTSALRPFSYPCVVYASSSPNDEFFAHDHHRLSYIPPHPSTTSS